QRGHRIREQNQPSVADLIVHASAVAFDDLIEQRAVPLESVQKSAVIADPVRGRFLDVRKYEHDRARGWPIRPFFLDHCLLLHGARTIPSAVTLLLPSYQA